MTTLQSIEASGQLAAPQPAPLWRTGFRPFYLLGSGYAALGMLLWIAQWLGIGPAVHAAGFIGHAHEMVFGFVLAIVAGFLLTAVPNWTNTPPVRGLPLMALAGLWCAARVAYLLGGNPANDAAVWGPTAWNTASIALNAAFPVALAVAIGQAIVRTRNRRNQFFIAIVLLLASAAGVASIADASLIALSGTQAALDLVLFIMVAITGRVVPMFTKNGVPGSDPRRIAWLERAAPASVLAFIVVDVGSMLACGAPVSYGPQPLGSQALFSGAACATTGRGLLVVLCFVAAALLAMRSALWQPMRTWRTPIVWILHVGHAWIVAYLVLRGMALVGWIAPSAATHALTAGAIGSLTLGMMTRTARGHTARPLKVDRMEIAAFVLVVFAGVIRVGGALATGLAQSPTAGIHTMVTAGVAWSLAFALYFVRYAPMLTQPRLDGRPG